ncbi:MAG: biotin/lipoyl-binding protein [Rhodoplanes sp.]
MARIWRRRIVALVVLAALASGAAYLVLRPERPAPIIGVVRTTEITVAPEVGGRLAVLKVRKGDHVHAGDVLAELAAPELTAAVGQARAALDLATASRDHVYAGARDEEKAVLAAEIRKAQARVVYAEAQHARTARLAQDQFASQQALDQAVMDLATGRADVAEAKANYAVAMAGPTKEERAIADAKVLAAAAELAVLERRLEKNMLRAPADGTVQVVVAEVGEAVRAGQPVLTIETALNRWLSFNVREDRLHGTAVGKRVDVMPAGANGPVSATVTELLPLGSFATWQAARAVGDHDRNTLRMRVEAEGDLASLGPGTTVWLSR